MKSMRFAELLAAAGCDTFAADFAASLEGVRHECRTLLLALEWGPPSGLIGSHLHDTATADRPIAQIVTLLVDPEARCRGIGRFLVKAGAQAARRRPATA